VSVVQASPSSQLLGPLEIGSQVSPDSTTALSQTGEQSVSSLALQPLAHHPSLYVQLLTAV
jgi:hypothetical protein